MAKLVFGHFFEIDSNERSLRPNGWVGRQNWEICRGFRASAWISNGLDQCSHPQHLSQDGYIYINTHLLKTLIYLHVLYYIGFFEIHLAEIQQFMYSCITAPQAWRKIFFNLNFGEKWGQLGNNLESVDAFSRFFFSHERPVKYFSSLGCCFDNEIGWADVQWETGTCSPSFSALGAFSLSELNPRKFGSFILGRLRKSSQP